MTSLQWITYSAIVSILWITSTAAETLNLKIDPLFELVPENWTVDSALPNLSICPIYNGWKNLTLSIISGDPQGYFRLKQTNATCSTLVLAKALDADIINTDGSRGQSFNLAIKCTDGWLMVYGNFDVQVVDVNDNAPKFVKTDNAYMVSEDSEIGSHLFTVTTFDPDTGVGGIDSFIIEVNGNVTEKYDNTFEMKNGSCIDSHCSGVVRLAKKLNYDVKNVYKLTVVAFDGAGRSPVVNRAKIDLIVNVKDVQNNPPKFLTDSRIQFVAENTPVGTEIVRVQAVDGDAGVVPHNEIKYQLAAPSPYFDINTTTGSLYVSGPLDRENPEIFKSSGTLILQVVAEENGRDFGDSKAKSTLMLTIVITDVDDEKPRCNQTLYEAKIFEDAQRMIPLVFTNAQDLVVYDNDEGPNGQFELSIVGPNFLFDINPKKVLNVGTAIVRLQESNVLDFERQKVLWLQVILKPVLSPTVADTGKNPACDIRVQILDSNDNVPQFSHKSYYGVVMENSKPGTSIINVTAFDLDTAEYGPLIYSLHGPGSDLFIIDDHVGTVKTKRTLDRERKSEYELTVTVQDENGKGHKNSTNLKIYVADDNDNAPKFKSSRYVVYLYENGVEFSAAGNGSREFMVEAFDADQPHTANSNITYTVDINSQDQNHGHLHFLIDESSGRIKVRPPGVDLELMKDNLFNLTVSAHDQNKIRPLSSSVQVFVYVNDTNDNRPTFDRGLYNISILENATYPYNIAQLKAVDNDRSYFNSLIAYRIVNVQDKFTIHPETGVLSLSESVKFDREAANKRHYRLNISATDQGIPSNTGFTIISINVVDINDKLPVFREKNYQVNVREDARHGKILLNLTAVDPDEDVHLFYYVAGFEDAKTEDGTMVGKNKYNYSILFSIHPFTGQLSIHGSLDREIMEQITLLINVTDLGAQLNAPQTDQTKVHVILLDVNDNKPIFIDDQEIANRLRKNTIPENLALGSLLLTVKAKDIDRNKTIVYSMVEHSSRLVSIDSFTGEVINTATIDYETITSINFTIMATDSGTPQLSATKNYVLKIQDLNDNAPIFEKFKYSVRISEYLQPATVILTLKAFDLDSGPFGSIRYFLSTDNTPYWTGNGRRTEWEKLSNFGHTMNEYFPFEIDSADGKINVTRKLDRETTSFYTFTVKAVDNYSGLKNSDSHEAFATVEIFVADENDNIPQFDVGTPKILSLTEKNKAGMHIFTFHATDVDDQSTGNGQVTYKILSIHSSRNSSAKTKELFTIDQTTGYLRLNKDLTQLFGAYELLIEASDSGTPKRLANKWSLKIDVQDVNDNPPQILFPTKGSSFFIPENNFTDENNEIVKLQAVDYDADSNADIRFSLKKTVSSEDWKYFQIDKIFGRLYPRRAFDYEKQERYYLFIEACDRGDPPLCSECDISIEIIDKDDNCPIFDQKVSTKILEIQENSPIGTVVGHIPAATDKDGTTEHWRICYEIYDDLGNELFRLSNVRDDALETPQLITSSNIDREKADQYVITIKVTDCDQNKICGNHHLPDGLPGSEVDSNGNFTDPAYFTLRINVADENDNDPMFIQSVFIGGVQYDTKIGSRVAKIRAIDADLVDHEKLRYFLDDDIRHKIYEDKNPKNDDHHEGVLNRPTAGDFREKTAFHVDPATGDITTTAPFGRPFKGYLEFSVLAKDSGDRVARAKVIINILSYEQQIELTFDAEANVLWENSQEIINLLSTITESNATIDDVQAHYAPFSMNKSYQSKALVHFVNKNLSIMAVEEALQRMDLPESPEQKRAKQDLLVNHRLRYANRNSNQFLIIAGEEIAVGQYGLLAVSTCLTVTLIFVAICWCWQTKNYKQRLKAATTKSYNQSGMPVSNFSLPGTNKHTSSNPIWRAQYQKGKENYGYDLDKNSLDENDLTSCESSKPLAARANGSACSSINASGKIASTVLSNGRLLPRIVAPQPSAESPPYFYQTENDQQHHHYYIDQKSTKSIAGDRRLSSQSPKRTVTADGDFGSHVTTVACNDDRFSRSKFYGDGCETATSSSSKSFQIAQKQREQNIMLSYLESTEL